MSIPQPITSFAYRISGPIDAAINLILNTAIMGYVNGVRVTTGKASYRQGLARALIIAVIGSAILGAVVYLLNRRLPELQVSTLATILVDGLGSAIFGYWMQVAGVFAAHRDVAKRAASASSLP